MYFLTVLQLEVLGGDTSMGLGLQVTPFLLSAWFPVLEYQLMNYIP